jgi:hypothetical protein
MAFLIPENLRSRRDVSAAVQRVGAALKNGLDDDAIAWFEPLFDPSGQRPHFVVLLPDNGIAVMEVLDIRANRLLGTIRGQLRIERDGNEVELHDPLARADAFAATLRERIANEPRFAGLQIAVRSAAVFTGLERAEAEQRGMDDVLDLNRCLFRTDIEAAVSCTNPAEFHRRIVGLLGASSPLDGQLLDIARGLVQPEIVIDSPGTTDEQLPIFLPPEGDDLVRVMDLQQEALAKSIGNGHRVVRGVAGSGKTLILVYRAKLLAQLLPQHRFLLTCYTRSLASVLRTYLSDYPNVEVAPLFKLVARAANEADLPIADFKSSPDGEEQAAVGLEALRRGALPRYRAVFIDEAQDFGPKTLRFAVSLADERFNDVLVVADAAQNIFRRPFSWKDAGVQAQGRTRILRRNYRNTREILEVAHAFLVPDGGATEVDIDDETMVIPPEAAIRQGAAPVLRFGEKADVLDWAIEAAKEHCASRAAPRSLALLTIGNSQAIDLERRLRRENLPFFYVTDPQQTQNRDEVAGALEPIVLSTIYSAKGLEFPSVILCCTPRSGQHPDEVRPILYVGMTRATDALTILADPAHPLAADLRAAADDLGRIRIETP